MMIAVFTEALPFCTEGRLPSLLLIFRQQRSMIVCLPLLHVCCLVPFVSFFLLLSTLEVFESFCNLLQACTSGADSKSRKEAIATSLTFT
jgi:hypothetical protein